MATTVVSELINLIGFQVNRSQVRQVERAFSDIRDKASAIGRSMTAAISAPLAVLGGVALKAASDNVEVFNKFQQVFGGLTEEANDFALGMASSLRRSEASIQDNVASLQSFVVGMGFANDEAFEMTKTIQRLVFDFASFNNISDAEAFQRFISALSGSAEVMDRFGINLKASGLDAELMASGIAESSAKATEMQKVLARVSIIEKAMGRQGAIGDATRTMFQFASALKSTMGVLDNLIGDIGGEMLPIATAMLNKFNEIVVAVRSRLTPEMKKMIVIFAAIIGIIGPIILIVTGLISAFGFLASGLGSLSAIAAGAGTTVGLLIGKFLLIAAAIAVVIAAIALLIEDFLVFQRGGNSLIGHLIKKFKEFSSFLEEQGVYIVSLFSSMFGDVKKIFDGFMEFFTGIFSENWLDAVQGLAKVFVSVLTGSIKTIAAPLQGILDIFNKVAGTNLNIGPAIDNLSNAALTGTQALIAQRSGLKNEGFNPAAIAQQAQSNFYTNSNINLTFPVGTDQSIINTADQQLRKAVRDELMTEIRKVATDNPRVQR